MIDTTGNYEITNNGDVIRIKTNRKIKPQDNGNGYKKVTLTVMGKQLQRYVHRLVAICYVPNPNKYKQVNHKDGNKSNNDFSNLEWVTNSENQIHAHATGLKQNGNKLWNGKFTKEQIAEIKSLKKEGILQYKIAEKMKTTKGTISEILSGKRYKYV